MADNSVDELCKASAKGNLSKVNLCLQDGAEVNGYNKYNRTALQVVMLGHTPLVEVLLVAGADPNIPDPACGVTVLHDAARGGFIQTVRVLLQHEADANLVDGKGNLPLHLAASEGYLEVVKELIEHTTNPQAPNSERSTARQLAQQQGKMDIILFMDQYFSSH